MAGVLQVADLRLLGASAKPRSRVARRPWAARGAVRGRGHAGQGPCGAGPGSPRGRRPLVSAAAWAVWHVTALVSGCRGPLHLPICMLDRDLAATGDRAGRGCRETSGLGFEQEPGLGAGMDDRPGSSPCWPQISESRPKASGSSELGGAPWGRCPQSRWL